MPIVDNEDEREDVSCLAIAHEEIAGVPCIVARPSGGALAPGAAAGVSRAVARPGGSTPVSGALAGDSCAAARPSGCSSALGALTGVSCAPSRPSGGALAPGALVVLDGTRVLRRVDRLVAEGVLDPACLPVMVGIDPDPADRGLAQYTPWPHPAYKPGAPDFGGAADAFLADTVLPVAEALRGEHPEGPIGLFGYSLAGLFGLFAMLNTDVFSTYLLASPSTWYPGIVNRVARTPLACDARVIVACGANEGLDHPEPIAGIRQDTDRLVACLSECLTRRPVVVIDELDHHRGLAVRLQALLERWG